VGQFEQESGGIMSNPMNALLEKEQAKHNETRRKECSLLAELVQSEQYVGETLKMDYREVVIQVNDFFRRKVGGIPHLSYLVASRVKPGEDFDPNLEDSSVLLLRVLGSAPMPSDSMDTIIRAEAARRATGREHHWDAQQVMDGYTRNELNYAGLVCEIVGTFFLSKNTASATELQFGTDLSNFYPNTGLKVYKPINKALETIVNFRDLGLSPNHPLQNFTVNIGRVRYASSNRNMQGVDNVQVSIAPMDLLAQRSALFGMSRTGKSNTTKIIARAIYRLRLDETNPIRVGQLILDYNGEYANENTQGGENAVANALKNVYLEHGGNADEVVTYGLTRPKQDPNRRLLQINAYGNSVRDWNDPKTTAGDLDMLLVGKEILADLLSDDPAKYVKNFLEVDLAIPTGLKDFGIQTRYRRQILVYRTLLTRAGLSIPPSLSKISPSMLQGPKGSLFNADLIKAMTEKYDPKTKLTEKHEPRFVSAAETLSKTTKSLSWDELANAFESLIAFINQKDSGYAEFDADYLKGSSSGQSWADNTLLRLLEMFRYPNGSKAVARLEKNHEPNTTRDFAEQIYDDLKAGKLVIVDQGGGDPLLNDAAAKRIMWAIFKGNQKAFTSGDTPPDLLVYVEEAHNLLPNSSNLDLRDIWVRTAKEGSKYRIGLVYATQEVSSIQRNILKNTANWFIAHLNNSDETKELRKFYDFANFEDSILRAQDRGFLRVKTLSNPYINPVQIEKFILNIPGHDLIEEDSASDVEVN
jgi:Helicase HerA, central domain